MGPIAFVLVFLVVPLAAAVFAGAFFAAVALFRLAAAVPTAAWAGLAVAATVVLAARLWAVLHRMPARPSP
jgi:hypothetical protein